MKAREVLIKLDTKYKGDWDKIYQDLLNKVMVTDEDKMSNEPCITIVDENYPQCVKEKGQRLPFVIHGDEESLKHIKEYENTALLLGKNTYNYKNYIYVDNNAHVRKEGTNHKIWCGESLNLALMLCDKLVITKVLTEKDAKIVNTALYLGKDIFVCPTIEKSFNNQLIREGAILLDESVDPLTY